MFQPHVLYPCCINIYIYMFYSALRHVNGTRALWADIIFVVMFWNSFIH